VIEMGGSTVVVSGARPTIERAGIARAGTAPADALAATLAAAVVCALVATGAVRAAGSDPASTAVVVATVGLGGLLGLLIVGAAAASLVRRTGRWSGPADRVTLVRGVLIAGCATLAVPVVAGVLPERAWPLVLLLVPALALDAVDGRVARRSGTSSAAGGKLDGEMDAAVLLVLSLAATRSLGVWVLGIGLMRYAFFAAGYLRPALRGRLGFSQFRRVVAALQGVMLAVGLTPVVPQPVGQGCAAVALALLSVSFGLDVRTLERARYGS
jgi:phosphatidylglycerophosphate synthase